MPKIRHIQSGAVRSVPESNEIWQYLTAEELPEWRRGAHESAAEQARATFEVAPDDDEE